MSEVIRSLARELRAAGVACHCCVGRPRDERCHIDILEVGTIRGNAPDTTRPSATRWIFNPPRLHRTARAPKGSR